MYFNPRTLWKSATIGSDEITNKSSYFNPRTLWKSATLDLSRILNGFAISIYALYERVRRTVSWKILPHNLFQSTHSMKECDYKQVLDWVESLYFNPRTLWKSATSILTTPLTRWYVFQSTHSMKECDPIHKTLHCVSVISIHALYERVRRMIIEHTKSSCMISIHALYERVRRYDRIYGFWLCYFNPRTLWKSATYAPDALIGQYFISIHALYERVRRFNAGDVQKYTEFQSTHSMKECDLQLWPDTRYPGNFNPRTLWKSATIKNFIFKVI